MPHLRGQPDVALFRAVFFKEFLKQAIVKIREKQYQQDGSKHLEVLRVHEQRKAKRFDPIKVKEETVEEEKKSRPLMQMRGRLLLKTSVNNPVQTPYHHQKKIIKADFARIDRGELCKDVFHCKTFSCA